MVRHFELFGARGEVLLGSEVTAEKQASPMARFHVRLRLRAKNLPVRGLRKGWLYSPTMPIEVARELG